ncbi:MAG TPA: ribonuclease P [Thermoplasmata archaeon]|nr:ribonuclease P [Thermoplasmata archaeon]
MVRIARERVTTLFALADSEASAGRPALADRYVRLARRIGTRYNVRLLPEFRELYCRGCSTYWIEGRTVRTRLRAGRRVRTCLACGRARRTRLRGPVRAPSGALEVGPPTATPDEPALVDDAGDDDRLDALEDDESPVE